MNIIITRTGAIDQLRGMYSLSRGACELIIDHYEGIDDDFYFYPEHLGSEWTEKTAEEIMRDHDATPQEVCDYVDHFYCSYGQNGDVDTFVFKDFGRFKLKVK